ncbi:MAG TPA: hypothetical protein VHT91_13885 [Kofleriaceae bacterium]|nr:hypothetical protein [Kofleriaceae bacterium]
MRSPLALALLLGIACGSGVASTAAGAPRPAPAGPAPLTIGGGAIEVAIEDGPLDLSRAELVAWISHAARAVTAYFGRFPVAHYRIVIEPVAGRSGVLGGTTWSYGGAHSRVNVGEHATVAELDRDWVMTHEMVHTAFPQQERAHHWIEEGMATYVEPLARSWTGRYPAARVWTDLVSGLPNGLPRRGDRGLDHTHTWGRTYWGGALFCLLADLEIRERTGGRRGLVDALRGILAAGGNDQVDWPVERAFREGDKAVGVPVLEELYRRMKDAPVDPDLDGLWRGLGVEVRQGVLQLDDQAPKAAMRRAISAPAPSTP